MPSDIADPQSGWESVRLLDHAEWKALVHALLEDLAADGQASGTLVTVQGVDFVLQRDAGGTLHVYRLESKPAALKVGRRISEEAFPPMRTTP